MSEISLNTVIRQLREARVYLQFAQDTASGLMRNHNVASDIHFVELNLSDVIRELDVEYRKTHFKSRRR